jgi:hypothetical protein
MKSFKKGWLRRKWWRLAPLALLAILPVDALPLMLVLSYMALVCYSSIRLVRAESPEEQARAQRVLAGCVIAGVLMAIAKPVASWATGIDFDNPSGNLPAGLVDAAKKLLDLLMYVGVVVVVAGIIFGGIQLRCGKPKRG